MKGRTFTQVATPLADDPTFAGIGRDVLVLAALCLALRVYELVWWCDARSESRSALAPSPGR